MYIVYFICIWKFYMYLFRASSFLNSSCIIQYNVSVLHQISGFLCHALLFRRFLNLTDKIWRYRYVLQSTECFRHFLSRISLVSFFFPFYRFPLLFRARISTVANSGIYLRVYIALTHQEISRYTATRCRYYYIGNNFDSRSFSLSLIQFQFSLAFLSLSFLFFTLPLFSYFRFFLSVQRQSVVRHDRQLLVSLLMKSNRLRPSTSR